MRRLCVGCGGGLGIAADPASPRARENPWSMAAEAPPATVGNVAHKSDVRKTAGYVANHLRSAEHAVALKAAGPPAINIAVKALCLARKYLADEGLGLAAEATFVGCDERPFSNEVRLTVRTAPPVAEDAGEPKAFNVSQRSKPASRGRDEFRETLAGKTTNTRHRRVW